MEKDYENSFFRNIETHNLFLDDDTRNTFDIDLENQPNSERLQRVQSETINGFRNFGKSIAASQDTPYLRDSFKPRKIRRSRSHMNPTRNFMEVDDDIFRRKKQRNSFTLSPIKPENESESMFTLGRESVSENYQTNKTCLTAKSVSSGFSSFTEKAKNIVFLTPTREELSTKSSAELYVQQQVEHISLLNIKLVAVDFDQTLLSIHTKGAWKRSAACLAQYVRPVFKALLPALLRNGVILAIVSFSPQLDLIERVLNISIKQCCLGKNVFICGGDQPVLKCKPKSKREFGTQLSVKMFFPSAALNKVQTVQMFERGKCKHLQLVLTELLKMNKVIDNKQILYIDDDPNNIALCRQNTPNIQSVRFMCCNSEVESENWFLNRILEL